MKFLNSKKSIWPIAIILIFYLVIGSLYLSFHEWDFTSFVIFGEDSKVAQIFEDGKVQINDKTWGYDGQAFYLIAKNPFDFQTIIEYADSAIWRYQRILFPLIVYLLSGFGQATLLAFVFPLVNLAAILLGTLFLIKILKIYQVSPWFSLFYGLNPAFIFTFLYNLAEPLAYLLVLIGVYFYLKNKIAKSIIFLILAALTKETCLFIALGLALYSFFKNRNLKKSLPYLIPWGAFLVWYSSLYLIFPSGGIFASSVSYNLGSPFVGLYIKLTNLFIFSFFEGLTDAFYYLLFLAAGIIVLLDFIRRENFYNITAGLFLIFIFSFSTPLLMFPKEYTRHFLGFYLFFLLSYLPQKNKAILLILIGFLISNLFFLADFFVFFRFFR